MKHFSSVSLLLTLSATLFWHCEKGIPEPVESNREVTIERFIFGQYRSYCGGTTCVEYYLLEDGVLYVDQDDRRRKPFPLEGDWLPRPAEEYKLAASLPTDLPADIWLSEHDVFGAPDAYDQGGYYIEVLLSDGVHRSWRLDTEFLALPPFLEPYTRRVAEVLVALEP